MNQLEYFVGSSEAGRADVIRYLRLLRDLDFRIDYHLSCIRALPSLSPNPESTRKRSRPDSHHDAPPQTANVAEQFSYHKTLALRHSRERNIIAAELLERSKELKTSLTSRNVHLNQILEEKK
ncbi:hypothetical protein AGDE_02081 [Angomonas deanei]|uniref:Uncharacterized protein n=1 Tax=Angomonas deanei TaxID=59799 RepID=A0A7G2CHT6_9TRYP|nr:hypothetical protein AGDE_02081 [Angomonas deanei]CAD2218979.1 hypothetical protein, conserved [Angomonas deanei]|eukprot:EPY41842.1 hypothetical protein AGDE_02081 [Angomonas deanei]